MISKYKIILFITFNFLFSTQILAKEINLGVTEATLKSSKGQFLQDLYTEVFKTLGYNLKITVVPPIRLAMKVKSGDLDGELVRKADYGKERPFLVRVDEPHFRFSLAAYSSTPGKFVARENSTIGYRKGMLVAEEFIKKQYQEVKISQYSKMIQPLKLLASNRLDYFIDIEYFFDEQIKMYLKTNSKKIFKNGILKQDSAHMFLNSKHKALANRVSQILRVFKSNGKFKQIKKKY